VDPPAHGTELTLDPVALGAHSQTVRAVACPTERTFASLGADGLVLWDLDRPPRGGSVVEVAPSVVQDVDVRPGTDADVAIATTPAGGEDGQGAVEVRRVSGDRNTIELGTRFPLAIAYSPDGATLAVSGDQQGEEPNDIHGWATVYDADTLSEIEVARLPAGDGPAMRAVAVRGPDEYAAGDDGGAVRMVVNGDTRAVPIASGVGVRSMAYMPDGHLLVGDAVGNLYCFDPAHPSRSPGLERLPRAISSLAAGTDRTVVAGIEDGGAIVFVDARIGSSGADGPTCDPHEWTTQIGLGVASDAVASVALAADDTIVLVGTVDGTVEIWDVTRRRRVGRLATGQETKALAAVAPNASVVAVGAGDTVDVYRLDRTSLRKQLCDLAGRELTEDELDAYLPDEATQFAGRCG
jgi:WD40 repeat protein